MAWYSSIEPRHVRRWSRLFRYQYVQCARTWCITKQRGFSEAQIAAFDSVKVKGKTFCYWYELVTQLHDEGYNPLQVMRYVFEQSIVNSHSEFPRPKHLRYPKISSETLHEQFDKTTEVSIRSDLVVLSRTKQLTSAVVGNNIDDDQVMEVIAEVVGPKLHNLVVKNAVLGYRDTSPWLAVACEFMTAPSTYLDLVPTLVTPKLRSLPTMEGQPVG